MDKKATKATFAQLMCSHRVMRNGDPLKEELDKVVHLLTDN